MCEITTGRDWLCACLPALQLVTEPEHIPRVSQGTLLYKIIAKAYPQWLSEDQEYGRIPVPKYVRKTIDSCLQCGVLEFLPTAPSTSQELHNVCQRIVRRIERILKQSLSDEKTDTERESGWSKFQQASSQQGMLAVVHHGEAAQSAKGSTTNTTTSKKKGIAQVQGFNLHAHVTVPSHQRKMLEKLLRYCLRPCVSLQRISLVSEDFVAYRLKQPKGANTHISDE